jgi:hypothetical protein
VPRVRAAAGPQRAPAVVLDDVVELPGTDDVVEPPGTGDVVELPGVAAEDPQAARAKPVTATSSRRLTESTVRTAMSADK